MLERIEEAKDILVKYVSIGSLVQISRREPQEKNRLLSDIFNELSTAMILLLTDMENEILLTAYKEQAKKMKEEKECLHGAYLNLNQNG